MIVTIKQIRSDWDMRSPHRLRDDRLSHALRKGEVILCINKRRTMARLVDSEGVVYTQWSEPHHRFNLPLLKEFMLSGIGLTLHTPVRMVA